jgi:hypothetical protein
MACDFLKDLAEAREYSSEHSAAFLLDSDPLGFNLKSSERSECIAGALQCGREVAQTFLDANGELSPYALAAKLKIKVIEAALTPARTVISVFDPALHTVTLNSIIFEMIDTVMSRYGTGELFGRFTPQEVAICHEFFHYAESLDDNLFSKQCKTVLWRVGTFAYESTIPAVSEIGAMACAKSLCQLVVSPLLLDMLVWEGMDSGQARRWFDKLKRSHP